MTKSNSISLCEACNCMTKTYAGRCGKCGSPKSNEKLVEEVFGGMIKYVDNSPMYTYTDLQEALAKERERIVNKVLFELQQAMLDIDSRYMTPPVVGEPNPLREITKFYERTEEELSNLLKENHS